MTHPQKFYQSFIYSKIWINERNRDIIGRNTEETAMSESLSSTNASIHHKSPVDRFRELLVIDVNDLSILATYTIVSGLLSLAVPLAAQAIVNTIAAGIFLQPLVVLATLVLVGLLINSVIRILKFTLAEDLQQRIFARIALSLSERIPEIRGAALTNEYMPELINRFFDVITVQKSWAKLLLEVPSALLQVCVGIVLMTFYSPLLLAFGAVIVAFIVFSITLLGTGGLTTSIRESVYKYRVAEWLEDLGRCQVGLKTNGVLRFLTKRTDELVLQYLHARRSHFAVLYRQAFGAYIFQAIGSSGILAIGGWLVINRQLTLGQLVAAELVVISVLSALEKLIRNCDTLYDLLTGLDKIGHITDLPVERQDGVDVEIDQACEVRCQGLRFAYNGEREILEDLDLLIESGERASLVGASGAGKSTLASIICGNLEPTHGTVEIGGFDLRDANLRALRRKIGWVGDANEIFEGTIEENVGLGRPYVSHADVRWALEVAQFSPDMINMPEGLRTLLISGGRNLSRGQVQRLLIARAIAERPNLLILDEAFTGIDERTKLRIIEGLFSRENNWTVVDISHDAEMVSRSNRVHVMSGGTIVESGTARELATNENSQFSWLFPDLSSQLRQMAITDAGVR